MKRSKFHLLILLLYCFNFINCDKESTVSCGDFTEYFADLEKNFITSTVMNNQRTLIYENLEADPSDICTNGHLDAFFEAKIPGGLPLNSTIKGYIYWYGSYEQEVVLVPDQNGNYVGHLNVGLKEAFQGKKGWIGAQFKITIDSKGTLEEDRKVIENTNPSLSIQFQYYSVDEETPPCGKLQNREFMFDSHDTSKISLDSFKLEFYHGSGNGITSVDIFRSIDHVCITDSIKCSFMASVPLPSDLTLGAELTWHGLQKEIPLIKSNDTKIRSWAGSTKIGLVPAFNGYDVGRFEIATYIDFPFQGSARLDTLYFDTYFLTFFSFQVNYSEYFK